MTDYNDLLSAANVEDIPAVAKIIDGMTENELQDFKKNLILLGTIVERTLWAKLTPDPLTVDGMVIATWDDGKYVCFTCGSWFMNKAVMTLHSRTHRQREPENGK